MTAPCKDCPKRYVGCHSECAAYLAYQAECAKSYQLRRDLAMLGSYVAESQKRQKRLLKTGKLP